MKAQLSHKDIVKLGLHESARGHSLNRIEADFHKMGIGRKDAVNALKTIDYMKKREERKAARENQAKSENSDTSTKNDNNAKEAAGENKSSFLLGFFLFVLIVLIGLAVYLYFSGKLDLEFFNINLK